MKNIVIVLFILLCFSHIGSQIPFPENGKLFQDTIIPRIDISFSEDSLAVLLADENIGSFHLYHADFIFTDNIGSDTIKDIGFRLRGNTSRISKKKSFKVSFNSFESGRKYHGVEKLNLNGEHNDPSIVRSKLCADLAVQIGIVASRVNHVRLYINNKYFGLYMNVEHIDEEFVKKRFGNKDGNLYKCLYPADLKYLGNNPDYYKKEFYGKRIYDLKTNKEEDDYSDLEWFVRVLNTKKADEFRCELEKIFNVDAYLRIMAFDILTGNWDGYIFDSNNYYLYHNTATNKIEYIPYDLDNTFGIDWFNIDWSKRNIYKWENSSPHPLFTNILKQPIYRSKFTSIMKEIIDSIYVNGKLNLYLDGKKNLISSAAKEDTFRTLDYGFSFNDFLNSFEKPLDVNHVPIGLKKFIDDRRYWGYQQLELEKLLPEISSEDIVYDNDSIQFLINVKNTEFLSGIKLNYRLDNNNQVEDLLLNDLGENGDLEKNDGIYSSDKIQLLENKSIHYYFTITDTKSFDYRIPTCDSKIFTINSNKIKLAINEFMASNNSTIQDENGEYDDWIELYNYGTDSIYIGDKYLTDNPNKKSKWIMPEVYLYPNEYVIFWADKDIDQGENHCDFKLSSGGEYIGIFDSESSGFELIDGFYFDVQQTDVSMGRIPDGVGDFVKMTPTPGLENITVSTVEIQKTNSLQITPNFTNSFINVSLQKSDTKKITISIIDVNGAIVKSVVNDNNTLIDVSELPKGIYFVNVVSGKNSYLSKFVKF